MEWRLIPMKPLEYMEQASFEHFLCLYTMLLLKIKHVCANTLCVLFLSYPPGMLVRSYPIPWELYRVPLGK